MEQLIIASNYSSKRGANGPSLLNLKLEITEFPEEIFWESWGRLDVRPPVLVGAPQEWKEKLLKD